MTAVDTEITPPPTPDYTPFATKLKDANPNSVYCVVALGVDGARAFEALRKLRVERPLHHLGASERRKRT